MVLYCVHSHALLPRLLPSCHFYAMNEQNPSIEGQVSAATGHYSEMVTPIREELIQAAVGRCEDVQKALDVREEESKVRDRLYKELQNDFNKYKEETQPRVKKLEDTVVVERRNLVVCIDGTANQFGVKVNGSTISTFILLPLFQTLLCIQNSNVVELYHLLVKDSKQITFYNSGIGTYARPSWRSLSYWQQVVGHTIDLMIAWCVACGPDG